MCRSYALPRPQSQSECPKNNDARLVVGGELGPARAGDPRNVPDIVMASEARN